LTFETEFLELELREAKALLKYREASVMIAQLKQLDPNREFPSPVEGEIEATLVSLEEKLERTISTYANGAFVRLSTRSPKDSALNSARMKSMLTEWTRASQYEASSPNAANEDIINVVRCTRCVGCVDFAFSFA
jgi:hypothetical protein